MCRLATHGTPRARARGDFSSLLRNKPHREIRIEQCVDVLWAARRHQVRAAGTVSGPDKRLGMLLRGLCVKLSAAVTAASAHEGGVTSRTCRGQDSGPGWNEIFLNSNEAQKTEAADEALQLGHSIVVLHGLATTAECSSIRSEASAAASGQRHRAERRYNRLWDLARRVANVRQG